jgi:hypothetical protein
MELIEVPLRKNRQEFEDFGKITSINPDGPLDAIFMGS